MPFSVYFAFYFACLFSFQSLKLDIFRSTTHSTQSRKKHVHIFVSLFKKLFSLLKFVYIFQIYFIIIIFIYIGVKRVAWPPPPEKTPPRSSPAPVSQAPIPAANQFQVISTIFYKSTHLCPSFSSGDKNQD